MSDQQGEHNRIHRILADSEHIQDKRQEYIRDQRILVGAENTTGIKEYHFTYMVRLAVM
jgi:hypothetical protein